MGVTADSHGKSGSRSSGSEKAEPTGGAFVVAGALASHPLAAAFAAEVRRVHHRYAVEVVSGYRLCPHIGEPHASFGRFCVMLDRVPDLEAAVAEVAAGVADGMLVHLVYPLVDLEPTHFERFCNELHAEVARRLPDPPVHATFHPRLEGDALSPARMVGLLRRAPDPFVQFVPEGLHKGGTVFADLATLDLESLLKGPRDYATRTFERLKSGGLDVLLGWLADIRADRDRSYAPYLQALEASRIPREPDAPTAPAPRG
ncbi:MAG: hypothetical protein IT373_07590 [Polyangiaceae bacterium]|nr:hypothetical protein [Polyangiaceae bacterium]